MEVMLGNGFRSYVTCGIWVTSVKLLGLAKKDVRQLGLMVYGARLL